MCNNFVISAAMLAFNPSTDGFQVTPLDNTKDHLKSVALELGVLGCDKSFADVTIHCQNQSFFKVTPPPLRVSIT